MIAHAGISRTFQNIRLFAELSVLENVLVGMHGRTRCGFFTNLFRLPAFGRERSQSRARALELLRFVGLEARAFDAARNLLYLKGSVAGHNDGFIQVRTAKTGVKTKAKA